jgi:hypothetical protein
MDMIRRDMPVEDIDPRLLTFFADNGADSFRHFTTQDLGAILRDPDNMQMDRERCMGAMAIVTHARESIENLLKLPPKQSVRFYAAMFSSWELVSCTWCC